MHDIYANGELGYNQVNLLTCNSKSIPLNLLMGGILTIKFLHSRIFFQIGFDENSKVYMMQESLHTIFFFSIQLGTLGNKSFFLDFSSCSNLNCFH